MNSEMKTGEAFPIWKSRWWLKVRACKPAADGHAAQELYVPIWAIPLDWLHARIFGLSKIEIG